eukprot:1156395-Pelagomonas_calceolata.AAC.2
MASFKSHARATQPMLIRLHYDCSLADCAHRPGCSLSLVMRMCMLVFHADEVAYLHGLCTQTKFLTCTGCARRQGCLLALIVREDKGAHMHWLCTKTSLLTHAGCARKQGRSHALGAHKDQVAHTCWLCRLKLPS